MSLGSRLREERERLGLTQADVGVAPKTQRFYESGERQPDAAYLSALAERGADILYIVTGRREAGVLSREEAALLDNFRNIPYAIRGNLTEVAAALSARSDRKAGNEK